MGSLYHAYRVDPHLSGPDRWVWPKSGQGGGSIRARHSPIAPDIVLGEKECGVTISRL